MIQQCMDRNHVLYQFALYYGGVCNMAPSVDSWENWMGIFAKAYSISLLINNSL